MMVPPSRYAGRQIDRQRGRPLPKHAGNNRRQALVWHGFTQNDIWRGSNGSPSSAEHQPTKIVGTERGTPR
jgi:hypothetical protein